MNRLLLIATKLDDAIIMLNNPGIQEISVHELKKVMDEGKKPFLLDVRETQEHQLGNIGGELIQLGQLPERLEEIERFIEKDSETLLVVYCRSGARSGRAVQFLQANGFPGATNLKGGMIAWSAEIDPSVKV